MSNQAFTAFKAGLLGGLYDLDTASIKASFVRGYTFDATDVFVSDVTGSGTLNGTSDALAGVTLTGGVFDADDTTVPTTASDVNHGILLYQASAVTGGSDVASSAQRLIGYLDTGDGLPIKPGTGDTPIVWDDGTDKILKVG